MYYFFLKYILYTFTTHLNISKVFAIEKIFIEIDYQLATRISRETVKMVNLSRRKILLRVHWPQ